MICIAPIQLGIVGVACAGNDSILCQGRRVSDCNVGISSDGVQICLHENNVEIAVGIQICCDNFILIAIWIRGAIRGRCIPLTFCSKESLSRASRNDHTLIIKVQTYGHLIVHHVALSTALGTDNCLEVHVLADFGIIGGAPTVARSIDLRIFLNLLGDGGILILLFNRRIGVGRGGVHDDLRAVGGCNQVVTGFQSAKSDVVIRTGGLRCRIT